MSEKPDPKNMDIAVEIALSTISEHLDKSCLDDKFQLDGMPF